MLTLGWVILAVAVFYAGVYAYLGTRRLAALLVLRVLAIAVLVGLLFKPAISIPPHGAESAPVLAVLVDRSASMATHDEPALPSRYAQAVAALLDQRGRIERHFRPAWEPFAQQPGKVSRPDELAESVAGGSGHGPDRHRRGHPPGDGRLPPGRGWPACCC